MCRPHPACVAAGVCSDFGYPPCLTAATHGLPGPETLLAELFPCAGLLVGVPCGSPFRPKQRLLQNTEPQPAWESGAAVPGVQW